MAQHDKKVIWLTVNGVHSNTTSSGPRVPLGLHGVELSASLQEGLVDSTTVES
jgi:hypothetical protein